ncbi:hypothetical protein [Halomonas huangheensis]|uniref:Uncharacterized protein n=1 Tax=Halomonas huangheensis TaxID=1178482 RepID=W1N7I0_9GAMM|nr:hypothetical protein [Halomonas huangheensis]ALM53156.1 hypothetical protein AR456_13335 [Halomonas huangheensis]ERL51493.1 hypothetical protein BJB45_13825 [Halomonas huangheensis]
MDIELIRDTAFGFPVIFFTILLPVIGLYWLLVALRLVPLQVFEHDSLRDDHLASTMVSLGFAGIPVTVALSVLWLYAGLITLAADLLVLRWFDLALVIIPLGMVILWGAFALASPLAARTCRALAKKWRDHPALCQRCLLGERVQVVGYADDSGCCRAVLCSDGTREICLKGKPGAMPQGGETRVLVKYLAEEDRFRSVAEKDFLDARARLVHLKLIERHERPHYDEEGDNAHSHSH